MVSKRNTKDADKRVPVAVGLMVLVLALLGSQQISSGGAQPSAHPTATVFASASAPAR